MKLITIVLSIFVVLACKENSSSAVDTVPLSASTDLSTDLSQVVAAKRHDTNRTSDISIVSIQSDTSGNETSLQKSDQRNEKNSGQLPGKTPKSAKSDNIRKAPIQAAEAEVVANSTIPMEEKIMNHSATVSQIHDAFNELLKTYVNPEGIVDYSGLRTNQPKLTQYLDLLSKTNQDNMSIKGKLAFWINLYNAATLNLILDHYPIASIMDIDNGKTWDVKRVQVGERVLSLNQIEHEILRPQFNDPRIHFAVNCAAKSCPPLANMAFTEENVHSLLDQRTRLFINNRSYNNISAQSAQISKIFEWYSTDFGDDLITYLNEYLEVDMNTDAKITFNDYDWQLNGK